MNQISFIINASINTLAHLKLLLESLRTNLRGDRHEILVFIDSDNEGIYEYLKSIKTNYYDLKIVRHDLKPCVGYSRNSNLLVELASHKIVSYLQSDMIVCKDYDLGILEDLEDNCILSCTRIEPPLHGPSEVTFTANFGLYPENFQLDSFIQYSESVKSSKTINYFFAPFSFYKSVWLDCGGYDTLFRKSREDSDLLQRLLQRGVKIKQTYKSNVYHFSCVSSRGKNWFDGSDAVAQNRVEMQKVADNIELKKFFRKWGGFNHGESKLEKYDVDLVITDAEEGKIDVQTIMSIEPYFSRIWLKSPELVEKLVAISSNGEDLYANYLLGFTELDWQNSKPFYNRTDYTKIYRVGTPENWNVKIQLECSDMVKDNFIISNPAAIRELVKNDVGTYETDFNTVIDIRACKTIEIPTKVENPKFDMNLIHIE